MDNNEPNNVDNNESDKILLHMIKYPSIKLNKEEKDTMVYKWEEYYNVIMHQSNIKNIIKSYLIQYKINEIIQNDKKNKTENFKCLYNKHKQLIRSLVNETINASDPINASDKES